MSGNARGPAAAAVAADKTHMRRALALATKGWGQTAPNPMVGAVVVRGGEVVGEGYHERYGGPHAEVHALQAAGSRARGATVYVTLEPCAHFGKTPPCADALIAAGVARVVVAAEDPTTTARGGAEKLRAAGIAVETGLLGDEARELNAPFFHAAASDRPWVTLKLAVSLDGAIADAGGRPGWISNEQSRAEVHRMRASVDAIAVGIGTALADDPLLTVRGPVSPRVTPTRVVFDRNARLPLTSKLVATVLEAPVVIVAAEPDEARAGALARAGVHIERAASPAEGMRALARRGIRSMLVEGGAALAGALLAERLVDRLVIFQAPVVLGAGARHAFAHAPPSRTADAPRLRVLERRAFGDDLMTVYAL